MGEIVYRECPWCGESTPLDTEERVVDGMVYTCETCGNDFAAIKCPQTGVIFLDLYDEDDLLAEEV